MKKNKFDLLRKRNCEGVSDLNSARVIELRAMAHGYQDINNKLVGELWDIEQKLVQLKGEEGRSALIRVKTELSNQIETGGYVKKIEALCEEIKTLEMALYGFSELDSSSPYQL